MYAYYCCYCYYCCDYCGDFSDFTVVTLTKHQESLGTAAVWMSQACTGGAVVTYFHRPNIELERKKNFTSKIYFKNEFLNKYN